MKKKTSMMQTDFMKWHGSFGDCMAYGVSLDNGMIAHRMYRGGKKLTIEIIHKQMQSLNPNNDYYEIYKDCSGDIAVFANDKTSKYQAPKGAANKRRT